MPVGTSGCTYWFTFGGGNALSNPNNRGKLFLLSASGKICSQWLLLPLPCGTGMLHTKSFPRLWSLEVLSCLLYYGPFFFLEALAAAAAVRCSEGNENLCL